MLVSRRGSPTSTQNVLEERAPQRAAPPCERCASTLHVAVSRRVPTASRCAPGSTTLSDIVTKAMTQTIHLDLTARALTISHRSLAAIR